MTQSMQVHELIRKALLESSFLQDIQARVEHELKWSPSWYGWMIPERFVRGVDRALVLVISLLSILTSRKRIVIVGSDLIVDHQSQRIADWYVSSALPWNPRTVRPSFRQRLRIAARTFAQQYPSRFNLTSQWVVRTFYFRWRLASAVNQVVFLRALEDLERWDRLRVVGDFHGNTIAMMHVANRWNRQIEVFLHDHRVNQQPDVPVHTVHCFAANHFSNDAWPEAVTVIEQVRPRARAMSDRISVGVCGDKFTPLAVIVECVHQIQQSLEQQCEIVVRPHPFVLQQRGVRA